MRPTAFLLVSTLVASSCGGASPTSDPAPAPATAEAPTESFDDVDALHARLTPKGDEQAVLVNFWATWCPPCIREMPELVELHEEWRGKGARVQTVALDVAIPRSAVDSPEEVAAFADERGYGLPIVSFGGDMGALVRRYGLSGSIPETLVLDTEGEIVSRVVGPPGKAHLDRMIREAVDG